MLKKLLRILGAILFFIILAFAALMIYTIIANNAADKAARAFCGNIPIGSEIGVAVVAAERTANRNRLMKNGNEYLFLFQGGVFHAGLCRVGVADGKVISVRAEAYGD